MPSTLADLESRIAALLYDASHSIFSVATIDEALKQARDLYSDAAPCPRETVITTLAAGREIALNAVSNLLDVTEVWFPYESSASAESLLPRQPAGFRLRWDDAQPILFLTAEWDEVPEADDELYLFYTVPHTIQNLDSASATTIPAQHESHLCRGAAGFCALTRSIDLAETAANMAVSTPNLAALANIYLNDPDFGFVPFLDSLRAQSQITGAPFSSGWRMEKYDYRDNG